MRVFINDIHAAFEANTDEHGRTTLKATLNKIDLSRINDPDNKDSRDFLGDPAAYKTLSGSIIYHYYEKIEEGEEYDYINKVVRKLYRYEVRKQTIQSFSFRTDEEGIAAEIFKLEHPNNGWYTAELIWNDNNGRVMNRSVYLSNRHVKGYEMEYDWYHLDADKEKYRLDEEVTVTLKNNEETVASPNLFVYRSTKGITNYSVIPASAYRPGLLRMSYPTFISRPYISPERDISTQVPKAYATIPMK